MNPFPLSRTSVIRLVHIHKAYRTPAGPVPVLREINLEINAGEFVAIIGKSGSGKSTLLNMVTGIDRPSSGEVWIADAPIHALNESQLARWRGKHIGIVFQFFQLLPTLSLLDNVMLPMDFANLYTSSERRTRALHLLEHVDMSLHVHKLPAAISGGQQQRVAIARALANDPPLLVADEPTGNLDSATAESVYQLFVQLTAQGKTVVMVTHDNDLARRAKRTVVVADGVIVNEHATQALTALDVNQLSLAAAHFEHVTVPPGSVIIRQGDPADRFYIVVKGECDAFITHPGGGDILLNHFVPGMYFGEIALVRGGARTASVRAWNQSSVELLALDRDTFQNLAQESRALKDELDRIIAARLANVARADASSRKTIAPLETGLAPGGGSSNRNEFI